MELTTLVDPRKELDPDVEDYVLRQSCQQDLAFFVELFWDQVPGAAPLVWNWHIDLLCEHLQRIAERVFANLPVAYDFVYNLPPGLSKSSIASILYPAWIWTRMPHARFLCASHTDVLVLDLSVKCRSVITGELYQQLFPDIKLAPDQDTKSNFRNLHGGERMTATVGGKSPTGRHAHFHICDDLVDPKGASSIIDLQTARQFLTDVLPSRKVDKAVTPLILIMQRLVPRDPTDVVMERARKEDATPVVRVVLPAEESDKVDPPELRANYVDGLLDPKRLPRIVLKRERASMTATAYDAQYGQDPRSPGAGRFKDFWFNQRVRAAPYDCKRVRAWDRASTDQGGCFTAGVLLGRSTDGKAYVEDCVHGQWEPDERNERILATAIRDRTRYGRNAPLILIEDEGGSSGKDASKTLGRKLAGFRFRFVHVSGSKDVRCEGWADYLASGNVWLVDGGAREGVGKASWDVQGYVDEHIAFRPMPGKRVGGYVDRIDATSLAYNHLFGKPMGGNVVRAFNLDIRKGGLPLRYIVATQAELEALPISEPAALVYCCDPAPVGHPDPVEIPPHGLEHLMGWCVLPFLDASAEDFQAEWDKPVEGYGKKPEQILANRDVCRKLWGLILRRHAIPPRFVVFVGEHESDGRPGSVAMAVADGMNYKRKEIFIKLEESSDSMEGEPPNRFVYETFRAGKSSVVG